MMHDLFSILAVREVQRSQKRAARLSVICMYATGYERLRTRLFGQ